MAIGPHFQARGHQNYYLAAPLTLDQWTHVAYVFDAKNDVTFYLDGQLIGTVLGSSPADPSNPDFRVGGGDTAGFIDAHLDDIQVYDGSLTAAEVAWLFAHPGAVLQSGPGTSYCSGDGVAPSGELPPFSEPSLTAGRATASPPRRSDPARSRTSSEALPAWRRSAGPRQSTSPGSSSPIR